MSEQTAAVPFAKTCIAIYGVYAGGVLLGMSPYLWLLSTLMLLVGVVMAYIHRSKAKGTFYESHYHWQIRTFWIGGGVYLPIMTLVASLAIVAAIDFSQVEEAVKAAALEQHPGSVSDQQVIVETVQNEIMTKHRGTITTILFVCTAPIALWWLRRCWLGYQWVKDGKAVENVERWT